MTYQAAVITVSDKGAAGLRTDESGPMVAKLLTEAGYQVVSQTIIPDEQLTIQKALISAADRGIALIVTTGGTGFSPRDVTPEATIAVCERMAPGVAEEMRRASRAVTSRAILSRAVAGIRGGSFILNLPGSPKAARENLQSVLEPLAHGLEILTQGRGECAMTAEVVSINISEKKGEPKHPIQTGILRAHYGIEGDAHAGMDLRQVSLLGEESVDKLRGVLPDLQAGAFAENIVTRGIELFTLPIGTKLRIGAALCEVTQIGKDCHNDGCSIRRAVGDCVMPREGIFVRVLEGGAVTAGDGISFA